MTAFIVAMCAIGLGVVACLLYMAWGVLSLAAHYAGRLLRRARGRAVAQPIPPAGRPAAPRFMTWRSI